MSARIVMRPAESRAVADFLTAASSGPTALLVEGEAGIGKTTLLLVAVDEARERGFLLLSARSSAAESVFAYAVLADLLGEVEAAGWAELSDVQRLAVDRVLLRTDAEGPATDWREVAASFLTIVEHLADKSPVLLAIDDLQWLDSSSRKVIAYAARRFTGRVGLLGAVRTGSGSGEDASWLQMSRPDTTARITVPPLNLGGLHAVVTDRLGRSFRRPTMVRIWETSAGNPFYALELARALGDGASTVDEHLPSTLTELVRARIGILDRDVQDLLLAASCVASPTVELAAAATGTDADQVFELLEQAENNGIVGIEGHRIRFEHPLLARGVYVGAATARRRAMHRRLAEIVEQPELRARHLALAARHGDHETLHSLDAAAEIARIRGAPSAAAELLDLAAELGGDTPERRIRSARYHFNAGDAARARGLLEQCVATPGLIAAEALTLLGVMEILEGSREAAAGLLQRALGECGDTNPLRVQILVPLSIALFNSGLRDAAANRIDEAVAAATELGEPHPLSEALSVQVSLKCWLGHGVDQTALQRALELEDPDAMTPIVTRPSMHNAVLLAFTGQLDEAHEALRSISADCDLRGEESEQSIVAVHRVLTEIWRGNFTQASAIADDALERASLLDGDLPRAGALTMRAAVAAYVGRPDQARRDAQEAQPAVAASGAVFMTACHVIAAGFLEVSLGNYPAVLSAVDPLLSTFDPEATEIYFAAFVPDAAEAMVALDRLAEAEPLVDALERNGSRLDRPWMLAVGARCRAMLLAARGDVEAANRAVEAAMVHHDRLPMPFERARTQVLLGQLQRRQRRKDAATASLRDAVRAFEEMGTTLWADRARAELARADVAHVGKDALTPSERRVAELAAGGMSNRDIAKALFISPKTVEANLARIYRKLDIHSRTQLSRHIKPSDP